MCNNRFTLNFSKIKKPLLKQRNVKTEKLKSECRYPEG